MKSKFFEAHAHQCSQFTFLVKFFLQFCKNKIFWKFPFFFITFESNDLHQCEIPCIWTRPIYYLKPLEIDSKLAFISSNFWFPDYLQVWLLIGVFMKDSFIFDHINSLSTQLRENTCLVHSRDPPLVTLHFTLWLFQQG